jgi:hypothetical protein
MTIRNMPEVGQWYAQPGRARLLQVVAFDEEQGLVELQDFDGDIDEVDLDTWRDLHLEPAEAPEDARGSVDDADADELEYTASDGAPRDWRAPLDELPASPQDAAEADLEAEEDEDR